MRLTNSMLTANYLTGLQGNLARMSRYQSQLSTNRRLTRLSDDPTGAISILGHRSRLDSLAQYQRNIEDARSWLTQGETAVLEVNEVLKTAYEKTVKAATGTMGPDEKAAIAVEIRQIRSHLVQVANAAYGDNYIFGGYSTTAKPFEAMPDGSVAYQGVPLGSMTPQQIADFTAQRIDYEIGPGQRTQVSINGLELVGIGESNLFAALDQLASSLEANAPTAEISGHIGRLQARQRDTLALATEIGGRMNRLDLVKTRYEQDELNYKTVLSETQDIDTAEVIMQFKMAEAVYNSALSIGSKVIMPSLVDFLR
jgi:flagellar hook-associated protein 3 FlgL